MKAIKRTVIDNVPVGMYLVTFEPIWGTRCNPHKHGDCGDHRCLDNEPDYIAEVDFTIAKVTEKNYHIEVINRDETWNANSLGVDDTHDLRPRLFKTKKEASEHAKYTVNRFEHPQLWESFVRTE